MRMKAFKTIFLLSGAAGLIYQTIWMRLLSNILGSTTYAIAMVSSCFLLCLAIGAYSVGSIRAFGRRAILLYVWLEIAVSLTGVGATLLLFKYQVPLAAMLPSQEFISASLIGSFILTFLMVAVPAIFMGATLPVFLNGLRRVAPPSKVVASLYGWNTVGAAIGALATGYVLVWHLGILHTVHVAALLNILAATGAFALTRRMPSIEEPRTPSVISEMAEKTATTGDSRLLWWGLAALSGFVVLADEVLWGRMSKFLLGDRTLAISTMLFVFLLALGAGSLLAARLAKWFHVDTRSGVAKLVGGAFLAAAILHLIFVPLARESMTGGGLASLLSIEPAGALKLDLVFRILTMFIVMFPPVTALGIVFPFLMGSARQINEFPGRTVGTLYFVNTIAAVAGALTVVLLASRGIGTMMSFLSLIVLFTLAGGTLIVSFAQKIHVRVTVIICMAVILLGCWDLPRDMVFLYEDEELIRVQEDTYGVQIMTHIQQNGKVYTRLRSNRIELVAELGHWGVDNTQQMAAHLTTLLAGDCKNVLNIGTGYGITAGTFTLYNDVKAITTVEILPFLIELQPEFSKHNFAYYDDPRVRILTGDGRHFLLNSDETFDIISTNVLDPYVPGSSSLHTIEYWSEVKRRLRPGGVYTHLIWGRDKYLLLKGLNEVFPTVLYFKCYKDSYNIVAFRDPTPITEALFHFERLSPRAKNTLTTLTGEVPETYFSQALEDAIKDGKKLEAKVAEVTGRVHMEEYPVLEYKWIRSENQSSSILDSPCAQQFPR